MIKHNEGSIFEKEWVCKRIDRSSAPCVLEVERS